MKYPTAKKSSLPILASSHNKQTFQWMYQSIIGFFNTFSGMIIMVLSFMASINLIEKLKSSGEVENTCDI